MEDWEQWKCVGQRVPQQAGRSESEEEGWEQESMQDPQAQPTQEPLLEGWLLVEAI